MRESAECSLALVPSVLRHLQRPASMLFSLPGEVVAHVVMFLADYCDFRQLLWNCRAGGGILARAQSLDVAGVYPPNGSRGNPFDYRRFPALLRVSVSIRYCLAHNIYDFLQFGGGTVRELNLRVSGIFLSALRLRALMTLVEHDLSDEIHHIGIHLGSWDLRRDYPQRRPTRILASALMKRRDDFAQYILMLSNHCTLRSFAVSIAGEPVTLQWACQQLGIPPPSP